MKGYLNKYSRKVNGGDHIKILIVFVLYLCIDDYAGNINFVIYEYNNILVYNGQQWTCNRKKFNICRLYKYLFHPEIEIDDTVGDLTEQSTSALWVAGKKY